NRHAFNVDSLAAARQLDAHLRALPGQPASPARNTVVVAGAGLTGLETASEMPVRLRPLVGDDARVVLVDTAPEVGAGIGGHAAPLIRKALAEIGVETRAGVRVTAVDAQGVTLSDGERIPAHTLIWTAGMRASPLTAQI